MSQTPLVVSHAPPEVRHRIEGTRLADLPVGGVEILMHRKAALREWQLRHAADAYWRLYWPLEPGGAVTYLGRKYALSPGTLILIPPHTAYDSDCERPFTKWYVHFTLAGLGSAFRQGIFTIQPTAAMRRLLRVACPKKDGNAPPPQTNILVVLHLLSLVLSAASDELLHPPQTDARGLRGLELIQQRFTEKLALKDVARAVGVSERVLSQVIRAETGFSPMRYLQELRLNHGMKLLRHTHESIDQIAEECGFPNRFYFTRMLAKHRQTTPAAFRKQATL
jgi:AraC-like DNA-binding protein